MKKLFLLLLTAVLAFFILFVLLSGKEKTSTYNFILNFDEARKENFDSGSDLEKYLPSRAFIFNKIFLNTRLYLLFSKGVDILVKDGNVKSGINGEIGGAGFRMIFPRDGIRGEAKYIFKKKDESNYWLTGVDFKSGGICDISIYRMKNGLREAIDNFQYQPAKEKANILMFVFFRDFFIVTNEDTILFQMKSADLDIPGEAALKTPAKMREGFTVKFARMDKEMEALLAGYYKKTNPSAPSHTFNYNERMWNRINFRQLLTVNGGQNPFLRRIRIGDETRPAIFMKMNSTLTYDVKIPRDSVLEFNLSAVSKYIDDIGRLKFTAAVQEQGKDRIKRFEYDFSALPRIPNHFIPCKIDLKDFSGDCSVSFHFGTKDRTLKENEKNIILSLASPVLYPERKKDDLNVLLICLDTLRASNLGCYGYSRDTSQEIDSFAEGGTLFANAASGSNWTLSSHFSIFTSMYPFETGFIKKKDLTLKDEKASFSGSFISDNLPTLTQYLQKAGYKTMSVHGGGFVSDFYGFDKGFDVYLKRRIPVNQAVDKAVEMLEKSKNQKFFMFFHTYEIHEPYKHDFYLSSLNSSRNGLLERVIARYDSGIRFTDQEVGRLINWLKNSSLFEKTVVILISDHGENFDYLRKNPEAGSHGLTLYDAETHIPLIFGGAKPFSGKKRILNQVSTVDILPTLLDYLDIPLEADVRGASLMPLVEGGSYMERMAYSEATYTIVEKKSIRTLNYKLIATIYQKDKNKGLQINYELYNLRKDIKEREDVLNLEPAVAKDYMKYLRQIIESVEKNYSKMVKSSQESSGHDQELLDDLKGLGYIGN